MSDTLVIKKVKSIHSLVLSKLFYLKYRENLKLRISPILPKDRDESASSLKHFSDWPKGKCKITVSCTKCFPTILSATLCHKDPFVSETAFKDAKHVVSDGTLWAENRSIVLRLQSNLQPKIDVSNYTNGRENSVSKWPVTD